MDSNVGPDGHLLVTEHMTISCLTDIFKIYSASSTTASQIITNQTMHG